MEKHEANLLSYAAKVLVLITMPAEPVSWADEVDDNEVLLPPSEEKILPNGQKLLTEYRMNDGKKEKVVTTIKIETKKVSKSAALRKSWQKFGLSKNDKPGPNLATTIIAEEVSMQFVTPQDEEKDENDDLRAKLKEQGKGQIRCRICREEHWTIHCPYKEIGQPPEDKVEKEDDDRSQAPTSTGGKYVPPFMKEGATKRGDSMVLGRGRDEYPTIRVTNLSESTRDADLEQLVCHFGPISRIFLAKDKISGLCKGFAFVSYRNHESAQNAIDRLNGFGYDHLILKVEWSKPSEK